ncbi:MAG TPA: PAS domain S-box protein [Polyangiaceae bacterium]|nr:PAS domain S-box protein [Polyangiaceae bacterium]
MSPPAAVKRLPRFRAVPTDDCRLLVESITDYAIFMLDPDGYVATWNPGAQRIKGYAADEIIGEHFSVFYPPGDVAAGKPERELLTAAQFGRVEDEGWRLRKDGSRFWANVVITALKDEGGALRGFAKVTRDLTHRRATEEELRQAEERFHQLVDAVTDYAIFMLDPGGHVATWNVGASRIKGYQTDEILGRHFSVFYTPEDRAAGRPDRILEAVRRDGRYEDESWRVRKDGTRFWANVIITALRDGHGRLLGFAKITRDLTARRESEETARRLLREQVARSAAEEGERRLRESEERYRALSRRLEIILEAVGDGITVQDASGRVVFANTAAARVCGLQSLQQLLQAPPGEIFAEFDVCDEQGLPVDVERLPGRRALRGEQGASALLHARHRSSGREWWSLVRASPVLAVDGTPELAVNVWHDVTDDRRRDAESKLLDEATTALSTSLDLEEMLSMLAAVLAPGLADWSAIHLLERDELRLVAVAHRDPAELAAARRLARDPPDPRRGLGVWRVVRTAQPELYPDIRDDLLVQAARDPAHLEAMRAAGVRSVMIVPVLVRGHAAGAMSLACTESGRRFDERDLELAAELGRRAGTAVENASLYAAERTGRERLEFLAQAGEVLSGAFDYAETVQKIVHVTVPTLADFAFCDLVEGGHVRRVAAVQGDPEAEALLEATRWARAGGRGEELSALHAGETVFRPVVGGESIDPDDAHQDDGGIARRLGLRSMISLPLRARGEVLGSLNVCFGRSGRRHTAEDRKLAEELARRAATALVQVRLFEAAHRAAARAEEAARRAEEANRLKDEFLATVSHELRTPLNAILGWSTLLRSRGAEASIAKGIDVIHRNAEAQTRLVEDILDVSRIITGKLLLDLKPTDLVTVIGEAIEVVRPSADAKRITIDFEPPADRAVMVGDPERLRQVVWNLLSNAVKFTEADGRVKAWIDKDGAKLTINVQDTGRGIEPEFLPFVFDRFKQADSSTTRRFGGLGLGLAIVRHIVELHGGHVSAESAGKGRGALFRVSLPIRAVVTEGRAEDARRNAPPALPPSPVPATLGGLRVLVVDDDPDARELLHDLLVSAGARVETAESAAAGLEAVRRFRPDVLVSDIGMPVEDGYTFVRHVRALDRSEGGAIPSIALTAYTRGEDRTKALAAGFTTHVAKPVNPHDLVSAVANLGALVRR